MELVASQPGQVLGDDGADLPVFHIRHHLLKAGAVEAAPGIAIIHIKAGVGEAVLPYVLLQDIPLRRDLSRGVSPKFIKSCNPGTFLNLDSTVLGTYWMKAQPPFVSVGSCAYAIIT